VIEVVWQEPTDRQVLAEAQEALWRGDARRMRELAPVLAERAARLELEVALLEEAGEEG
jgi:hypothetical protein